MPNLMDDFDRRMQMVLQLAETDQVAVPFMPLFEPVDISEASR